MNRIVDLIEQLARDMNSTPQVLIVDDCDDDRDLMGRTLRKFGCEIFEASSAPEAKKIIAEKKAKNNEFPFNVVFVDLRLVGDGDGVDVVEMLHNDAPQVPVIVVTGYPNSTLLERATRIGYFGLVLKPLQEPTVEKILQHHRIDYNKQQKDKTA